ncbi:MAG: type I 3-dehydroquinate dehydratase, partial [Betaproteobacteria bacterium]
MSARICVSILPKNMSEALMLIRKAENAQADFVEVRLDLLEETRNLHDLPKSTDMPLIAANKLINERGYFSGTEIERQQTLQSAAKNGFEFVDVDFLSPKRDETICMLRDLHAKTIISYHNYDGIISTSAMKRIFDKQIASGASICKIVLTAKQIEDNLHVLNFVSFASTMAQLVCFCMGEQGKISRLLSPLFGAFFTFASLERGSETAPGQMTITEMQEEYKHLGP